MEEIWKDIEGYEGLYQVSNYGNIKSLSKVVKNAYGVHRTEDKILKPQTKKDGYLQIQLSKNGKQKHYKVHRLVALTYIANPNNYPCVNHKDENKSNNHVSNLEWCTYEYNTNYGTRNKRASEKLKGKMKNKKLTKQQLEKRYRKVKCIEDNRVFNSIYEASIYCVGKKTSNICNCLNGRCLTACGRHWVYVDV